MPFTVCFLLNFSISLCFLLILDTHAHDDHIDISGVITTKLNVPIYMHEAEIPMYDGLVALAKEKGWPHLEVLPKTLPIHDGDEIVVGNHKGRAVVAPGHTPGSTMFEFEDTIIAGDTLFKEGFENIIYYYYYYILNYVFIIFPLSSVHQWNLFPITRKKNMMKLKKQLNIYLINILVTISLLLDMEVFLPLILKEKLILSLMRNKRDI